MKRFNRWLFRGLGGFSLILCIVIIGFCIRSHWATDSAIVWGNPYAGGKVDEGCTVKIVSFQGSIEIIQAYVVWVRSAYLNDPLPDQSRSFGFPGFHWQTSWFSPSLLEYPGKYDGTTRTLYMSDWLLMPITAILPTVCLLRWLKRNRYTPDRCQNCGYDLRATPDRCPECGKIVEKVI
ncbi:MAG: hypothetical protein ABSB42_03835 [Tepidisphaeraceae bacterium]|jgi:hypothetical protein